MGTIGSITKKVIGVVAVAGALVAPATANASYTVTQGFAKQAVKQAAETRYEPWGVDADGAWCYPQGYYQDRDYIPGRYHRWVCGWTGTDENGDNVHGVFRITGHTGAGRFGYLPLFGGLKWDS